MLQLQNVKRNVVKKIDISHLNKKEKEKEKDRDNDS
jgi:6-pyruvoyl-tetrahydropterin synthase